MCIHGTSRRVQTSGCLGGQKGSGTQWYDLGVPLCEVKALLMSITLLEGLLLLTALTPSSSDLQKLVAFENAFDRIFATIDAEGSITHGGITVQDCLSLLANLLRLNVSNQSYFRETGWVKKLATLLGEAIHEQDSADGVADWARPQRDKNLWGLLAVLRLFLLKGSVGTQANQISFWQSGVLAQVLDIAFHGSMDMTIRAEVSGFAVPRMVQGL